MEQRRQAMLQLHLSDQQLDCIVRCDLYEGFYGIFKPENESINPACLILLHWLSEFSTIHQTVVVGYHHFGATHTVKVQGGISKILRALKFSALYKNHIFQCMGKIFCVEFQRYPLKFYTKYLTHTLKMCSFWTGGSLRAPTFTSS